MKQLLIIFSVFFSCVSLAQENALSVREYQLNRVFEKYHFSSSLNNDTIDQRFTVILMELLDPSKRYFLAEDQLFLAAQSKHVSDAFVKSDVQLSQVYWSKYNQRITAYKEFIKSLTPDKITTYSSGVFSDKERLQFATISTVKEKWMKQLVVSINSKVYEYAENGGFLSDSLPVFKKRAAKTILSQELEVTEILLTDKTIFETSFLMAYALAHDPHSYYFDPSMNTSFKEELSAEIERFGFSYDLNEENEIVITEVLPGSPAWLNGTLATKQKLKQVGKWENNSWVFHDVEPGYFGRNKLSDFIKTINNKKILLVVEDEYGREQRIPLTKAKVFNDSELVKNALMKGEYPIGYIYLPDFYTDYSSFDASKGCASDIAKCILKLKKDSISGLILDLRGNGGGILLEAIALAGMFVDYGPIGAQMNRDGQVEVFKDLNRGLIYDGPLFVLVDEASASASEVLASTLQDYGKAVILGRQTFGKATSQSTLPLNPLLENFSIESSDKSGYANVTQSVLYRVNGKSNQAVGLMPDILFESFTPRENLHLEEHERGFLTAPDCSKKMIYTSAIDQLPIGFLKEQFQFQLQSEWYSNYSSGLRQLEEFSSTTATPLSFSMYKAQRDDYEKRWKQVEESVSQLKWENSFTTNSFDRSLFEQNEILNQFNTTFLDQLNKDVELYQAVELMKQWLKNK